MGELFSIDADTKAVITQALDDIITEFGKECLLVWPPVWRPCANCVNDPIGHKSANRWKTGGPARFADGTTCPACKGSGGYTSSEESRSIVLKVEWSPGRFWRPVPELNVRQPYSYCQTKGYLRDVPHVLQCDHLVVQVPITPLLRTKFRLYGSPTSPGNIIQDRYFVATWEAK